MPQYEKFPFEDCQKKLMNYISKKNNNKLLDKIRDFIVAFSYFVYLNDEAYRYNLPYLPEQFKKLENLLPYAKKKWSLLNNVVKKINNDIQKLLTNDNKIVISINDFLKVEFNKKNTNIKIEFCEEPKLYGVDQESIFKIEYYESELKKLRIYKYQAFEKDEFKKNCDNIITIVKKLGE